MKSTAINISVPLNEDFDVFFKNFKGDSVFQRSRIEFPLKNTIKSDEGDLVKKIDINNWKYANFNSIKKLVVNKTVINKNEIDMLFSIVDTGVHVTYYFKNKKGLWQLSWIVDESD